MLDIRSFCQEAGIPYLEHGQHHHTTEGRVQLCCPFCDPHRTRWRLGYSLDTGAFNCWGCGSLRFWEVLDALLPRDQEVRKRVARHQIGSRPRIRDKEDEDRPSKAPRPIGCKPMGPAHRKYLRQRKFNPARLEKLWGLEGTAHLGGEWSWRIIVPVLNERHVPVAYLGRTIGDAEPPYKLTPKKEWAENPRRALYGIHQVEFDFVLIVEGVTDVWRLGPGAVATLGIDWKPEQANRLKDYSRRFILFDPEPLAQQRAEALAAALSIYPGVTEVVSGLRSDPGDLSPARARSIRRKLLGTEPQSDARP